MTFRSKILVLAVGPLIVVTLAVTMLLTWQSAKLARSNSAAFEEAMLRSKEGEIANLVGVAMSSIQSTYDGAGVDDDAAKERVAAILNSLDYGKDGYFFVYDYAGNNVVHPRQAFRNGRNWMTLVDPDGDRVIRELVAAARSGGGYHRYKWQKPSTEAVADKISYVVALPKWGWVLGTGAYLDDVAVQTSAANTALRERTRQSFVIVALFAVPAVVIVFSTCLYLTLDERRMADGALKQLTQRVIDTQESERARLARELHDGISQDMLGVRFAMELAGRHAETTELKEAIDESVKGLNATIREIREISHDLRPRVLDDMGLAAAIKNLAEKFSLRTGLALTMDMESFVDDLSPDARTALFRVTQEALNNVERHSKATALEIRLWSENGRARMQIADNGLGLPSGFIRQNEGLGLQNIRERVAHFDGMVIIGGTEKGTKLQVMLPRSAARADAATKAA